jgi:integrase
MAVRIRRVVVDSECRPYYVSDIDAALTAGETVKSITVDQFEVLSRYLSWKAERNSANYVRDHAAVLKSIFRDLRGLGGNALECEAGVLETWANSKLQKIKPATVSAYLFAFKIFLDWCVKQGLVTENVANRIALSNMGRPFRKTFGNAKMVKVLIRECQDPALKFILFAGFHAGLRKGEIVNCKPSWFDFSTQTISVLRCESFDTKDGEDRTIPLTKDFEAYLRVYRPKGDYMLPNWHLQPGKRYRYDFRKKYRSYMDAQVQRYGFPRLTIHDMRRTFASILVSSRKVSLYEVSKWLGDDIAVVERHYGHLQPHDGAISAAFD